jgi:hypothetical protein
MIGTSGDWHLLLLMLAMGLLAFYVIWRWCMVISELRSGEGGAAEQRSRELLRGVLSPDELQELEATGALVVRSPSMPGRVYRIPSAGGSVVAQEANGSSLLLCVQPTARLPRADVVLMHKLMIEGNEEEYLRVANIQRGPYLRPPLEFRGPR